MSKKLKIEFENKEDSWLLNSNSKYVLTAANINEIKEVVNNISTELESMDLFSSLYKYVRIIIPDGFANGISYECIIEMSSDMNFPQNNELTKSLSSKTDTEKFRIFNNGVWAQLQNSGKLTINDINKSLKIEIKDVIDSMEHPYFLRYKFVSDTNVSTDWIGFALGSFDNTSNMSSGQEEIVSCNIVGPNTVTEKSEATYALIGVKRNGSTVNITNEATFSLIGEGTVNGSTVNFNKCHVETINVIKASATINGKTVEASIHVIVMPIVLERLNISLSQRSGQNATDNDTLYENESRTFTVTAIYSNNTTSNVTNSCSVSLTMGECTLSNNTLYGRGKGDIFGILKVEYADPDFPDVEQKTFVKYIKYIDNRIVSLTTTLPTEVNYNTSVINPSYVIKAVRKNGSEEDITATAIVDIINGSEVTLNPSTKKMSVNKAEMYDNKTVVFIIYDKDKTCSLIHKMNITGPTLKDIEFDFTKNSSSIQDTFAGTTVNYRISAEFNGTAPNNYVADYEIECINGSGKATINKDAHTISINNAIENEPLIFKITLSFRGITLERYYSLFVKSIKLNGISINGNMNVSVGSTSTYSCVGTYDDGRTAAITSDFQLKLLCGNPLEVEINSNSIHFISVNGAEEAFTFNAIYDNAEIGHAERMFTVIVRNTNVGN
jgi:hypothetical protein